MANDQVFRQRLVGQFQQDSDGHNEVSTKGKKMPFDVADLKAREPFGQFQHWLQEVLQGSDYNEAYCMILATATKEGIPSARPVGMRKFDKEGIVFCTNLDSRKGKELKENPHCSLVFSWKSLNRVVRIEGTVKPLSAKEAEECLQVDPRACQIKVHLEQSSVIPNRECLDKKYRELALKYSDETKPVPAPETWEGHRVVPTVFEFWSESTALDWLADRLVFRRPRKGETIDKTVTMEVEDGWLLERLTP